MRTVKLVQYPFPWRFSGQKSEEPGPEYSVNSGLETSWDSLQLERVNRSMTMGL